MSMESAYEMTRIFRRTKRLYKEAYVNPEYRGAANAWFKLAARRLRQIGAMDMADTVESLCLGV